MKKRIISIFCVLLAIMIVFAGCDLLSGGKPNSGGGTSGSSQGSGSGTGGGTGSGGSGTGGSGTGGSGTGGGNGSGGSGTGTGGGNTPPVTPPENPPETPPENPPAPPVPSVSFDGTWVWTMEVPASSSIMGEVPAYNTVMQKVVIEGETAKSYVTTVDYQMSAYFLAAAKGENPAFNGPDLFPEYETEFDTGTVSVTDNALTVIFPDGSASENYPILAAVMADDGNSFSFTGEDDNGDPVTITYEKFTAGPLDGDWVFREYFDNTYPYYQILNKIVFYGDSFQLFDVDVYDYEDAIDDWLEDPTGEFPAPEYNFPYEYYGTYTVDGTSLTLTFDPALMGGQPADIPGIIGTDSFSIDEGEGIATYVRSEPRNVDATTLDGYYVQTALFGGKPANEYTIVIEGNAMKCYVLTPGTGADLGAVNDTSAWGEPVTYSIEKDAAGLSFTVPEAGAYKLITIGDWVYLSGSSLLFEKVVPETTGTPSTVMEVYYDGLEYISEYDGELYFYPEGYYFEVLDMDESGKVTGIKYCPDGGDFNTDDDATCTVTFTDTAAVISDVENWPGGLDDPAGTYTKYVRETDWPVVPAE